MRILLAAAFLAACNQSGGHCKLGNTCEDVTSGDLAAHEKDCKALSGEWSKGTCPSSDLVGTCTVADHQTHYYGGGANAYTKETASANCEHELHGSWSSK